MGVKNDERRARNFAMLDDLVAGKVYGEVAEKYGVSRSAVGQLWTGYRNTYTKDRQAYLDDRDYESFDALVVQRKRAMELSRELSREESRSDVSLSEGGKAEGVTSEFRLDDSGRVKLSEAQKRDLIADFHLSDMRYCRESYEVLSGRYGGVSTTVVSKLVRGKYGDMEYVLLVEFLFNLRLAGGVLLAKACPRYSDKTRDRACALHRRLGNYNAVASVMGMSNKTVSRWCGVDKGRDGYSVPFAEMEAFVKSSGYLGLLDKRKGVNKTHKIFGDGQAVLPLDGEAVDDVGSESADVVDDFLCCGDRGDGGVVGGGAVSFWAGVLGSWRDGLSRMFDRLRIWEVTRSKRYQLGYLAGGEDMLLRLARGYAKKDNSDVSECLTELKSVWRSEVDEVFDGE